MNKLTSTFTGELQIDHQRGVIYFHSDEGITRLRMCRLPTPIPELDDNFSLLDITAGKPNWRGAKPSVFKDFSTFCEYWDIQPADPLSWRLVPSTPGSLSAIGVTGNLVATNGVLCYIDIGLSIFEAHLDNFMPNKQEVEVINKKSTRDFPGASPTTRKVLEGLV
jgi:hypothetical protein